jgi:hypothetical protein
VPRAGLHSDLYAYFNDTSSEAVYLVNQLELFKEHILKNYNNVII